MGAFASISIAALFCYVFLFLTMLAAKKSRMINAFLLILGSMVLWTGGSFFMRIQLLPSTKFWYDVSLLGLMLLAFGYFAFAYEFMGYRKRYYLLLWGGVLLATWAVNTATGFFLAAPESIPLADGTVTFVYHTRWTAALLFMILVVLAGHMAVLLLRHLHTNELSRQQFIPIAVGILFLFAGHSLIFLPVFEGIPADILSGVFNALCILYALYRRHLFRLTLLISRGSCYTLSAAASVLLFANLLNPISHFLQVHVPILADYQQLVVSLFFTLATVVIYQAMKLFLDNVFVREEINQSESIKAFSVAISRSLEIDQILEHILDILQGTIGPEKVYILIADAKRSGYDLALSSSPLDSKVFRMQADHPVVEWFQNNEECLLMQDFRRTMLYKSMWEKEKKLLEDMDVQCLAPLRDDDNLVGILMLTKRSNNRRYSFGDISMLSSIGSIGSIAVKNSRLYGRAFIEARTDELTGLYNRKYFHELLEQEYEKNRGGSLALAMLNIDDFKLYNQLYGNIEGDIALRKIAEIAKGCVGENGHVARYSGKVFAVILPKYDLRLAHLMADNIRKQVVGLGRAHKDYALRTLTMSGGVAAIPYSANNPRELIEHADMATFHVKRNGKNTVMAYTNGDYALERTRNAIKSGGTHESAYSEYESTINALTAAIDAKDHYTFNHSKNVAYYATKLAKACNMNADYVQMIHEAALLHDIGKIAIAEHILNKPGQLTLEELEIMKGHVEQSIDMIRFLPSLDYVIPAVIGHHERYDGKGYPRGLSGEDIPVSARILCIADSFDAMISSRIYKEGYSVEHTLCILEEEGGRQFDPVLVISFVELVRSGEITVQKLPTNSSMVI